jgi:hypothetical protein
MWRTLAWLTAAAAGALHAALVVPLVAWWESGLAQAEESTKTFIRESFGLLASVLNNLGTWVLSAADASYGDAQRHAWQRQQAWQSWWREDRTSTLNAVVANAQQHSGGRAGRRQAGEGLGAGGGAAVGKAGRLTRACVCGDAARAGRRPLACPSALPPPAAHAQARSMPPAAARAAPAARAPPGRPASRAARPRRAARPPPARLARALRRHARGRCLACCAA